MAPNMPTPSLKYPLPRRNFFQLLIGLFSALWSLMALYPIFRFLSPPRSLTATANVSSVNLGNAASLAVGQGRNFEFGSVPGVIVRTGATEYHAYNATCTHLGCTVQYEAARGQIWCACHGGTYDPNTGNVIAGPPPRPLAPLQVTVQKGQLVVSQPEENGGQG